jgi:hypothetical protein
LLDGGPFGEVLRDCHFLISPRLWPLLCSVTLLEGFTANRWAIPLRIAR